MALVLDDPELLKSQAFIDGVWVDADDGVVFEVANPATGETLGTVPDLGSAETEWAIEAAENALADWKALTGKERGGLLKKWYGLILANQEDLARIMTAEQGKPLAEARGEIVYAASFLEWFAEEAKRVYGDIIPEVKPGTRILVRKEPVGVCAAVTPWNFPAAMITRKIAPALAAGCTVVIKPAEQTPLSALALGELADRAGFPKGVINILTGEPSAIGAQLTGNPIVRKLSFTGSTAVGKLLYEQCAGTVKKISLELGGNAPFIVFEDADLDAAIAGLMASKYRNAGQTCVCANRIYVHDEIYDIFAARLAEAVRGLVVGDGAKAGVTTGPLIDAAAVEKVEAHIADALDQGATLLLGGRRHELGGTFFEPTILTHITTDMLVAREETFGPVAPLFRFYNEEEVIELANDTEFGLAAYVYTRDVGRVFRVSEALEYGIVGVNEGIISNEVAPFGGVKESGLGREGSKYGMDDYLVTKYVLLGGIGK